MEPLNGEQLKEVLREWRAPEAPAHLEAKVFASPMPLWRWLLTGSIRIPVPVLVLSLIVLAAIFYSTRKPANPVGLANSEPVKQLNVRIIRSSYEPH